MEMGFKMKKRRVKKKRKDGVRQRYWVLPSLGDEIDLGSGRKVGKAIQVTSIAVPGAPIILGIPIGEDFKKNVKPHVVSFFKDMLELKGLRNALSALLQGSDLYEGDLNLKSSWEELEARFKDLANWGDTYKLEWDQFTAREINFKFFFGHHFATTHLYDGSVSLLADYDTVPGELPNDHQGSTISVADGFRLVKSVRGAKARYKMCLKVIPIMRGLTTKNLTDLASWIGWESYEEKVINFGIRYVR